MAYNGSNRYDYNSNQSYQNNKRKNGCKTGVNKNDDTYISGWKVIDGTMVSFYGSRNPNLGREIVTTKQGKDYEKWLVSVEFPNSYQQDRLETGFFDPDTKKLFVPDMNLMLDPNASVSSGRGGVWFMNN